MTYVDVVVGRLTDQQQQFFHSAYHDQLGHTGGFSWLSFVVSSVSLSLSHWYPGSGVVLDCIDS